MDAILLITVATTTTFVVVMMVLVMLVAGVYALHVYRKKLRNTGKYRVLYYLLYIYICMTLSKI